jgi:hypothetical protein
MRAPPVLIAWIRYRHSPARRSIGRHNLVHISTEDGPAAHPSDHLTSEPVSKNPLHAGVSSPRPPTLSRVLLPGLRQLLLASANALRTAQATRGTPGDARRLAAEFLSASTDAHTGSSTPYLRTGAAPSHGADGCISVDIYLSYTTDQFCTSLHRNSRARSADALDSQPADTVQLRD